MKKIIALTLLTIMLVGCSKTTEKFVGSRDTANFSCNIQEYETVQELNNGSELIVCGTVGDITELSENFNGEILYASKISFAVSEVLKGDINTNSIFVLQTGKPNSDNYETKLKSGKEYILYLNSKTFEGETVYDCTGIEQGIFEIKENGQVYSYVDFGISRTFDNKSIDALKSTVTK